MKKLYWLVDVQRGLEGVIRRRQIGYLKMMQIDEKEGAVVPFS
jgi:hypothetical protein